MAAISPGATLGLFGGGQLGRMTAMAAHAMGYRVQVLDPDATCPASSLVNRFLHAKWHDLEAVKELAQSCDVITLEIENIPLQSLELAARYAPVRPGASVLACLQDRGVQKTWLEAHGFPVGPFCVIEEKTDLQKSFQRLPPPLFVKTCRGGYDGRGQMLLQNPEEIDFIWQTVGGQRCVAEQKLSLDVEISVLVARRPTGEICLSPPSLNDHRDGILHWSLFPAPVPEAVAKRAQEMALALAEALEVVGLLAVEFFLTKEGDLLVNELAPRPHNSFHATTLACVTSQFEQLVRAVCDLPLGSFETIRPTAMINLLGELFQRKSPPSFTGALEVPGVTLSLYGKEQARPGRKMGHLLATGHTPQEALARAQEGYARFSKEIKEGKNLLHAMS